MRMSFRFSFFLLAFLSLFFVAAASYAAYGENKSMENYEIIQIDEQTWRVEEEAVRFFLLTGREKALLIDSGMNTKNAREIAETLTNLPISLLNTHADRDHVAGNNGFDETMMNPAEYANYQNAMGKVAKIVPVWDGDIIDLGDRVLEVVTIPGHTPGSIALLDKTKRVLYSGDSVQDGGIFMFGQFRDIFAYPHSLKKLLRFEGQFDWVYPAHGTFPLKPEILPALIKDTERLLRGEVAGEDADMFGTPIKRYNIGSATILAKRDIIFGE